MVTTIRVEVKDYLGKDKKSCTHSSVTVTIDGSLKLTEKVIELLKSLPDSEIR